MVHRQRLTGRHDSTKTEGGREGGRERERKRRWNNSEEMHTQWRERAQGLGTERKVQEGCVLEILIL